MKCSSVKTQLFLVACLSFLQVSMSHAGIITRISESGFSDADTLSFSASEYGSISATDDLFTNFGISDISAIASQPNGEEYARGDLDYVLWADSTNGVQVVKDGDGCASSYNTDGKCLDPKDGSIFRTLSLVEMYDINFSDDLTEIGFYMVDVWKALEFSFYLDGANVGTYDETPDFGTNTTGTGIAWSQWRAFSSNVAFDQIKIRSADGTKIDGFGIGQIRKEAVSVPEPSSFIILTASLFGLLLTKRRRLENNK